MKLTAGTITRTILLVVALVNQFLTAKGYSPIDGQQTADFAAFVFTGVTAALAWWKDNAFTQKARARKALAKAEKKAK